MYDKKIISSASFGLPVICVGNLSVGGTGKSPMTEYLLSHLQNRYRVAALSRGYKRRTKGYALADENTTALEIGDEPMQFHLKFPGIPIAVGEKRVEAIPEILHDRPDIQVIILDDAFQHRAIKAGLNILLTDYNNLFTRDFYLPTGDLRDLRSGYKRADIIVVTKCRPDLTIEEKSKIIEEIGLYPHQSVFFTAIQYGVPYHVISRNTGELKGKDVLLVSGIANPSPLKKFVETQSAWYEALIYPDHHIFTIDDWDEINKRFNKMDSKNKLVLSTEKDAVRLMKFKEEMVSLPFYILPVQHNFLFREGDIFDKRITNFIDNFK